MGVSRPGILVVCGLDYFPNKVTPVARIHDFAQPRSFQIELPEVILSSLRSTSPVPVPVDPLAMMMLTQYNILLISKDGVPSFSTTYST